MLNGDNTLNINIGSTPLYLHLLAQLQQRQKDTSSVILVIYANSRCVRNLLCSYLENMAEMMHVRQTRDLLSDPQFFLYDAALVQAVLHDMQASQVSH